MPTNTYQCQQREWWLSIEHTVKMGGDSNLERNLEERERLKTPEKSHTQQQSPVSWVPGVNTSPNLEERTRIFQILLLSKQSGGCGGVLMCVRFFYFFYFKRAQNRSRVIVKPKYKSRGTFTWVFQAFLPFPTSFRWSPRKKCFRVYRTSLKIKASV